MQYTKSQEKGWNSLTEKERSVLTLIVVNGRSKQEAAAILNLAYYKFNELYSRARKLFILFKEYYDQSPILIPQGLSLSPIQVVFVKMVLEDRKKPLELVTKVPGLQDMVRARARNNFWRELFESFDNTNPSHRAFKELVVEFDRWNSFRILPKDLRQPSPYLRRRNYPQKKLIESLSSHTQTSWGLAFNTLKAYTPPYMFVPRILSDSGEFGVERVKEKPKVLKYLTDNEIPVFDTEPQAKAFAELVFDYVILAHKSPHLAHRFWANFRLQVVKALNYEDLFNISKEDHLEFNSKDRAFIEKSLAQKSKKITIKPLRDGAFWD